MQGQLPFLHKQWVDGVAGPALPAAQVMIFGMFFPDLAILMAQVVGEMSSPGPAVLPAQLMSRAAAKAHGLLLSHLGTVGDRTPWSRESWGHRVTVVGDRMKVDEDRTP